MIVENQEHSFTETEPIMLEINRKPVPFFIEHLEGSGDEWLLKFEDINTPEEAEEICGLSAYYESHFMPRETGYRQVKGFKVEDQHLGFLGRVLSLQAKPGQDMLEVDYRGKQLLIPFAEPIITGLDKRKKIIYTNLPEGLTEINS